VVERQEKATRVLIAAAQRDTIAAQAAPLLAAGLLPAGVGVDVLGWWENIKAAGKLAERGGEVVILLTTTGAELMALHNGHPLLFRTLCQNPVGGTELIEEMDLALLALEAEWGEEALRLSIWRAPEVPAALAESIQGHTGLHTTVQELGTLSTLSAGIALRVCETKETTVNLVLPDWLALAQQRRTRRGLIITSLVVGLIWLLGLAVAVSGSQWQQHVATQLQHEQALLEGPAAEVRQQQAQLRLLQQYADPVGSALECLRDISAALPDGVKLTSLTFVKGQQITLRGEADDAKGIYTFQQGLKSSTRFKQVQLHGITPAAGKQTHTGFNVTLTLGEEATP
jgi:Tfp pilus assembly protein PilN